MIRCTLMAWALDILLGCTLAQVRVNVVSERTALENQVLGSYNALTQDVLLVASVRGVDPLGRVEPPPERSGDQQDAVAAVQVLAFHADDVEAFKALGWVGENNRGLLTAFDMDKEGVPEDLKAFAGRYGKGEFEKVVEDVNRARLVVMERVVAVNEHLTEEDLEEIHQVFGRLNAENARPGEKIQLEDGSWVTKK